MNPLEVAQQKAKDLKTGFFGSANEIKVEDLNRNHPVPRCAQLWLKQLDEPDDKGLMPTTILPRKKATDVRTQWYGVAFSLAQSRDLREQLTAFVGPTLSNYRGHTFTLDHADPSEKAIIEATGLSQVPAHFSAIDRDSGRELVDALTVMARVRASSEVRQVEQIIATGRVIRRFELALRARRRDEAESHLAYLRRHHRLDQLNLQFLEVQLRAELGLWDEIIDLPHFNDLVQVRRPLAVTNALLQALFIRFLNSAEITGDPVRLRHSFETEVLPRSGTLLNVGIAANSPSALKVLLAWAVHRGEAAVVNTIWERLQTVDPTPSATELSFWMQVVGQSPPPVLPAVVEPTPTVVVSDPMTEAVEALLQARLDDAWERLLPLPPMPQRAAMLMICAQGIGTLEARHIATQALLELDEEARETLLLNPLYAKAWQEWQDQGSGNTAASPVTTVPRDWLEWLDLVEDEGCSFARLHEFASQGASEWELSNLLQNVDAYEELEKRLETLAGQNDSVRDRLFAGIPSLLRFLERDESFPRPSVKHLFNRLRTILALYGETSDLSQWLVYADLCRITLELGLPPSSYSDLLEETELLWNDRISLSNYEAVLETLDILFVYPCPNPGGRSSLANRVFSQAYGWITSGRLDPELERFCRQLSRDYSLETLLPPPAPIEESEASVDPLSLLSGKTVAIYSLMENTLQRVRDLILLRCPSCTVELNHDKAATPALTNLARTADIFVVVTGSAKHAATNAITVSRPEDKSTVLVSSKGSSALLRALSSLTTHLADAASE